MPFEVKCSICGCLFTTDDGMKDTSCPDCGANIYDKDPNFDKWRNVPAIRVVGIVKKGPVLSQNGKNDEW